MRLENKVALVTGSSSGIGRAIAHEFAKEGANVVITYNSNKEGASSLQDYIRETYGRQSYISQLDIRNLDNIKGVIDNTVNTFGKIDILVNNAGFYVRDNFSETTEQDWDETFDTNVKGTYFCSQAAAKHMQEAKSGNIINITSNAIRRVKKGHGIPYGISKYCIEGLTESLATSLAPYIRVNAIAPGYTLTGMQLALIEDPELREAREKGIPLGRINEPEDVAKTALFLASEDSRNITGQTIYVDGGHSLSY